MTIHVSVLCLCLGMWLTSSVALAANPVRFADFDPHHLPPEEATTYFRLSQNYPEDYLDEQPWKSISFQSDPESYIRKVLSYALEGNVESQFTGSGNSERTWYHAPWLHDDGSDCGNGRESLHGLTRELPSPPEKLHPYQKRALENWAVALYNAAGGVGIRRVWIDAGGRVDRLQGEIFPEGTVSVKLLFSDAEVSEVPFLQGTLEWQAHIYPSKPYVRDARGGPKRCVSTRREVRTLRLIQVDLAVKDQRAGTTGWVFGTFMHDASESGNTPWERLVPVGISWGNDPTVVDQVERTDAFYNPSLKESWINSRLLVTDTKPVNAARLSHLGVGGRTNGPVDNPRSSCMSCHAQAALSDAGHAPDLGDFDEMKPKPDGETLARFFQNNPPGAYARSIDGNIYFNLDYSLQLAVGLRNCLNQPELCHIDTGMSPGVFSNVPGTPSVPCKPLPEINR